MKQKKTTLHIAAFLLVIIFAAVPSFAQEQIVETKKEANLFLTNKDGEKVFSYNKQKSLFVKLVATYLNADINNKENVEVVVLSDMEPTGETLQLTETGKNTGIFMGELEFKKSPMPFANSKFLEVENGDKITVSYVKSTNSQGVADKTIDNAYFNGPDWTFQNTGESHIILLHPAMQITIEGKPAKKGIFISAVFEKKNGDKISYENAGGTGRGLCPGGVRWMGKVATLAIWGSQDGKNNGMAEGETIKWIIWNPETQKQYDATATYMPVDSNITHGDKYTNNGISGIIKLDAK